VTYLGDEHLLRRLAEAGVRHAARAGSVRLPVHLCNDADDVDTALHVLAS
jgi:hypothetical protein